MKLFKNIYLKVGACVSVLWTQIAYAYEIPSAYKPSLAPDVPKGSYSEEGVSFFLQFLAGNLLFFAGAIAVLLFIWAGAQYVISMGNDAGMEKAKKTIQWTLIGMVSMIVSYAIVQFVIRFFLELPDKSV